ncbi:putative ribonuclease H-like domain-containing protein [Tanacetum coccineum]
MERGFLSQKGSGRGRGVKEKDLNRNKRNTTSGIGLSTESDDTRDEDTPLGVTSAVKEGVTPYVVDKTVEMEKISSVEDTTVPGSFLPLSTPGTTKAGNALGKSSYANVTGKPSWKKLNFNTLFTPGENKVAYLVVANYVRNTWGKYGLVRSMFSSSTGLFSFQFGSMDRLDAMLENVWVKLHGVPVTAFNEDGLSAIVTKLGTPLMLDSYTSDMCRQSCGLVVNDVELLVPIGGTTHLVNNKATSSGSSFMNVANSSTRTTPIIDKIWKFEELLTSEKATLVDEAGNPLKNVEYPNDYDSEDEV